MTTLEIREHVARAICRASRIDAGACKFCAGAPSCDPAMWRTFLPEADAAIATIDNLRSKNRAITEQQIAEVAHTITRMNKRPLLPGLGG
ncbi:MAG: hypothetical protein E6Q97_23900 [Desulfurellales bacterium]|nr:MAG: hypothetical protein E6Q97_23900 [Desulfurellales bacterium]